MSERRQQSKGRSNVPSTSGAKTSKQMGSQHGCFVLGCVPPLLGFVTFALLVQLYRPFFADQQRFSGFVAVVILLLSLAVGTAAYLWLASHNDSDSSPLQKRPQKHSSEWEMCAIPQCRCDLPKGCLNHECACLRPKGCDRKICICTRTKVCTTPACTCGQVKVVTSAWDLPINPAYFEH